MEPWLRKGLCGLELRKQTNIIAILYIVLASFGTIYGLILIESPEKALQPYQTAVNSSGTEFKNGDLKEDEDENFNEIIKGIIHQGFIIVIGCLISLVFSFFLLYGSRTNQGTWMLPWVIEQITEIVYSFVNRIIDSISEKQINQFIPWLFYIILYIIGIYITYSVFSHYLLIRKMKKHSNDIINSVMQGGKGYNPSFQFDALSEELSMEREMEDIPGTLSRERRQDMRNDMLYFSL